MSTLSVGLLIAITWPPVCSAGDRFTPLIENAGDLIIKSGGFVVNQKRVAVQKELSERPPTPQELGVTLPPKVSLNLELTARQIAQYHPVWRIYEYRASIPRAQLIQFFEAQGLKFNQSKNMLLFPGADINAVDFIDGLYGDLIEKFRIWRKPVTTPVKKDEDGNR